MSKRNKKTNDDYNLCCNCIHAKELYVGGYWLCKRKGLVPPDFCCRKFEIDLLHVTPKRPKPLSCDFTEDDFSINS